MARRRDRRSSRWRSWDPKVALLDEIDSGLDIDAVREVAEAVEVMRSPTVGVLMITHYSRILRYVIPDRVHVMVDGRLVDSGGPELAEELEAGGYEAVRARLGLGPGGDNGQPQDQGDRSVHRPPLRDLIVVARRQSLAATHQRWLGSLTDLADRVREGSRPCRPGSEAWAAKRGLSVTADRAGNLLVRPSTRSRKRPIVAVAHMDHPALVVTRTGKRTEVELRGGVFPEYLVGARLQIETSAGPKPARLEEFDPTTNRGWLAVGAC